MKHLLALFAVIVTVGSSTVINIPGDQYLAIVPRTCPEDGVVVSTPTPCVPAAPVVSTGPFYLKSADGSCRRIESVYPNGSTVPPGPIYPWVTCP